MASGEESKPSEFKHVLAEIKKSIQCVDNPNGVNGVVVYDEKTFAMTSEPDTIIDWRDGGDGQGPYRSVRPFHHEDDEPPPERDPHTQIDTKDDGYILNVNFLDRPFPRNVVVLKKGVTLQEARRWCLKKTKRRTQTPPMYR